MKIAKEVTKIFKKILGVGTPPDKEVLYKNVVKKKVPKESAEQLTVTGFKKSLKNMFTYEDKNIEFSRGEVPPPVKMVAKKTTAKKKATTKKTSTTKKPAVKKAPTKKSTTSTKTAAKKTTSTTKTTATTKPVAKKPIAKKAVTKKSTSTAEKPTAKKPAEKKVAPKKPAAKKPVAKKATTKKVDKSTATTKAAAVKKTVTKKSTVSTEKPATKKTVTKKNTTTSKATTKKPTAKKVTEKKTKTPTKKTSTKTATEKKAKAAPRGAKKAEKIALYAKDITKHYGEVDEDFLAIIVKNLGPSIYKRDAELVSCSDPKELDTVRKNFLMKKLGITASQKVLDAAIQDVCEELKATRTKYRATFYYSLAKKFKKESFLS